MHFMKSVIRVSHQKAQKCTYGANSIKLNAFYYSINLIRNHISVTTKTCIYCYCFLGCTCCDLKELHNRENVWEVDGGMARCRLRWERKRAWPDWLTQLVAQHFHQSSPFVCLSLLCSRVSLRFLSLCKPACLGLIIWLMSSELTC